MFTPELDLLRPDRFNDLLGSLLEHKKLVLDNQNGLLEVPVSK